MNGSGSKGPEQKLSLRLALLVCPQDNYDRGVDVMIQSFVAMMMPEAVCKELAWLMKSEYAAQMERRAIINEEVYSDDEMQAAFDFYSRNPWAIDKATQIQERVAKQDHAWGESLMKKAYQNLADRGEFEEAMDATDELMEGLVENAEGMVEDLIARDEEAKRESGTEDPE